MRVFYLIVLFSFCTFAAEKCLFAFRLFSFLVAKVNFVWGNQNLSEMYKKFCELVYLWEYARKTEQKDSALDVYETAISFGVGAINEYLAEIQKNQCVMQKIKTMLCK